MNTQAGVWAIIFCPATRCFLFGRRSGQINKPNLWNLFGGHVDTGEAPRQALLRELAEEAGFCPDGKELRHLGGVEDSELHEVGYVNALRQLHYFLLLTHREVEPRLNFEHSEYRWFAADKIPHNINRPTAIAHSIGLVQKILHDFPTKGAR